MSPSVPSIRQRTRDHGTKMSRLRTTVDQDTGEVYHIETTRQAKKRYQRSGAAQFKPTVGQINAADIWNKQEEKIKRDREREEKKKKNRVKQDERDAKERQLQQELLRKGKISIEDTWGRVNASQNRIHSFFGAAARPTVRHDGTILRAEKIDSNECEREDEAQACAGQDPNLEELKNTTLEDLNNVFTTSLLSPTSDNSFANENPSFTTEANMLVNKIETSYAQPESSQDFVKRKEIFASQDLMPPPKRRHMLPLAMRRTTETAAIHKDDSECLTGSAASARSPLEEMSVSQVNVRSQEKPGSVKETDCDSSRCFVATQVVRDTLSVICSQDLEDDFSSDDKENSLPVAICSNGDSLSKEHTQASHKSTVSVDSGSPKLRSVFTKDDFDDSGFDEFDDDSLDHESLLSLAATQRLKSELFASSKRRAMTDINNLSSDDLFPPRTRNELNRSISFTSKLGDSFATDGLNDDDLLQNLEDFENTTRVFEDDADHFDFEDGDAESLGELPKKKRRVLPWIKNPISYSFGEEFGDAFDLTPSPVSESVGD